MLATARCLLICCLVFTSTTQAADIRGHTRLKRDAGATISQSQAIDLTLTTSDAAVRAVQTWVRAAGRVDESGKVLTATLDATDAALITVGQRVRAFPLDSKSSMFQARVTRVLPQAERSTIEVTLAGPGHDGSRHYLMEIVVDRGQLLSVPNEAIIEEGDKEIVYVKQRTGDYAPRIIRTGLQGELYTQVLQGLKEGEQVVTIGSFFIDAEYKMKSGAQ